MWLKCWNGKLTLEMPVWSYQLIAIIHLIHSCPLPVLPGLAWFQSHDNVTNSYLNRQFNVTQGSMQPNGMSIEFKVMSHLPPFFFPLHPPLPHHDPDAPPSLIPETPFLFYPALSPPQPTPLHSHPSLPPSGFTSHSSPPYLTPLDLHHPSVNQLFPHHLYPPVTLQAMSHLTPYPFQLSPPYDSQPEEKHWPEMPSMHSLHRRCLTHWDPSALCVLLCIPVTCVSSSSSICTTGVQTDSHQHWPEGDRG